jgi:dipeptidase E
VGGDLRKEQESLRRIGLLSYWMRQSGLGDILQSVPSETVYVGVSAGSIAATSTFAETYRELRRGSGEALSTEDIVFDTPDREVRMILVKAQGIGLADFAIIPHVDNADHQDMTITEQWAARMPAPTYEIDDQTASIKATRPAFMNHSEPQLSDTPTRRAATDPRTPDLISSK